MNVSYNEEPHCEPPVKAVLTVPLRPESALLLKYSLMSSSVLPFVSGTTK